MYNTEEGQAMKSKLVRSGLFLGLAWGLLDYRLFAQAATLDVCKAGCPYSIIQSAIEAADDGDIVLVDDGVYTENIDFLDKAITLRSENGADYTTIDGNGSGSVVILDWSNSVMNGLTVTNGKPHGIFCNSTLTAIINCKINNNIGTGIFCYFSDPKISNCEITNNSGTGILTYDGASPSITNCLISGNGDSGIYLDFSHSEIINCIISGNQGWYGGGIFAILSWPAIINCTIVHNVAEHPGGGICLFDGALNISNSILWGNIAEGNPNEIHLYVSSISTSINYSDFNPSYISIDPYGGGGWSGTANINQDPLFVDPVNGDYHLLPGSPCIDSGDPACTLSYDMEGDPRPQGLGHDIGCDEFGCSNVKLMVNAYVPADGTYRNHGDYVSQASHILSQYLDAGLISEECAGSIMVQIAQSDIGKPAKSNDR
jgi:parallel beta-helix repeat protein